ncbi:ER membrane protein complex subunit 1-like [Schistocerca gregaria]|uniref:ER membrane protein complex subunit 1-like n=1 Tax=Schistocerca gregaria TaxID=7010 RepID=UPI00211E283F|nr:ER membrane protein complex subunit 1-like [Schistocerca gregaria]
MSSPNRKGRIVWRVVLPERERATDLIRVEDGVICVTLHGMYAFGLDGELKHQEVEHDAEFSFVGVRSGRLEWMAQDYGKRMKIREASRWDRPWDVEKEGKAEMVHLSGDALLWKVSGGERICVSRKGGASECRDMKNPWLEVNRQIMELEGGRLRSINWGDSRGEDYEVEQVGGSVKLHKLGDRLFCLNGQVVLMGDGELRYVGVKGGESLFRLAIGEGGWVVRMDRDELEVEWVENGKLEKKILKWKLVSENKIDFIYVELIRCADGEARIRALVQHEDWTLESVDANGEVTWWSDESLSGIASTLFLDTPTEFGIKRGAEEVEKAAWWQIAKKIKTLWLESRTEEEDRFGIRKLLVIATDFGKVLGIDTKTRETMWSWMLEPRMKVRHMQVTTEDSLGDHELLLIGHTTEEQRRWYQCRIRCRGALPPTCTKVPYEVKLVLSLPDLKGFGGRVRLAGLYDGRALRLSYPALDEEYELRDDYFFYTVEKRIGRIRGYRISKQLRHQMNPKGIWAIQLNRSVEALAKAEIDTLSPGIAMRNKSVLFKYLNPNIVAVGTRVQRMKDTFWSVQLIDVIDGKTVHEFLHKDNGPNERPSAVPRMWIVFRNQWLCYAYWSHKSSRFELVITKLFNSSSFHFQQQTWILPSGIRSLSITRTLRGISNLDLLIGFLNGQIQAFHLKSDDLSTEESTREIRKLELLPTNIINPGCSDSRLLSTSAHFTNLESTTLIFTHGLDLFLNIYSPQNVCYDRLSHDYLEIVLISILVTLSTVIIVVKRGVKRKCLADTWN